MFDDDGRRSFLSARFPAIHCPFPPVLPFIGKLQTGAKVKED